MILTGCLPCVWLIDSAYNLQGPNQPKPTFRTLRRCGESAEFKTRTRPLDADLSQVVRNVDISVPAAH